MKQRTALARVVGTAKSNEWCKRAGGFAVYTMSSGDVDYFPFGQPPNVDGVKDDGAKLVGRWHWNYTRWSRTQ